MKKLSRLEASKEVRRVMNRASVDLSFCQYMVSGYEVRLIGWLKKVDGSEFNGLQIEAMVQDFQRHLRNYSFVGDLDNWKFTSDHIQYLGERQKAANMTEEQFELEKGFDDRDIED